MAQSKFIATVLSDNGLDRYIPVFKKHEISEDVFYYLTSPLLVEMGITSLCDRLRILKIINETKPANLESQPINQEVLEVSKRLNLNEMLIKEIFRRLDEFAAKIEQLESICSSQPASASGEDEDEEEDDGIFLATPGILAQKKKEMKNK